MKIEIGYTSHFEVRKEEYFTDRSNREFTIAYLSDFHFTRFSASIANKLIEVLSETQPNLILLGGDFVDFPSGLKYLEQLCTTITKFSKVIAIFGNHDTFWGTDKLSRLFQKTGVSILHYGEELLLEKYNLNLVTKHNSESIQENTINLLFLHQPIQPANHNFQLILAGHLHGCQMVWWQNNKGLYPGKFFYKMNFLKKNMKQDNLYLISKGLGDTLPVRYNCKKDFLLITVKQKK